MREALCPILVGRDDEFAALTDLARGARLGRGGMAFLVGEAGIGKSRVAREVAIHAQRHGMRTVRGRAVETLPSVPFRPVAQAFSTVPELSDLLARPELVAYRSTLRDVLAGGSAEGTPRRTRSPMARLEGIARLLGAAAIDGGLVVVLEDLHWADADTLSVVEYLADSLPRQPILSICTARSDETSPVAALVARLTAARLASRVELRRLPDRDVSEMVRACLGGATVSDDTALAVCRRAEGVPFFVEELLTAALYPAASDGAATDRVASAVPASYADIVRRRVEGLGGRGRSVVEAAAVLGRTFDWSLLGSITGLDDEDVLSELRRASDTHLVTAENGAGRGTFAFRHALTRDAVLADLLPPERVQLCISAANALEATRPGLPAELCELAADLRERGGDQAGAFRLVMESARRAAARAAFGTAETALDRAMALAGDDPWLQIGAGMFLADVLASTGKVDRLVALGATLVPAVSNRLSLGTPDRVASIHLRLARGLLEGGEVELARARLADADALARAAGDASILIACDALAAELALAAGDLGTAEAVARDVVERAAPENAELRCVALRVVAVARRRTGDLTGATEALEEARALAETAGLAVWRARVLLDLAAVDELSSADVRRASLARALAGESGTVALEARSELQLGRILLARGEIAPAEEAIDRAIAIRRQFRLPPDAEALTARAVLLARSGRRREQIEMVRQARASALAGNEVEAVIAGEAQAVAYLLAEDATKALGALDHAAETTPDELVPWAFLGLRSLVHALVAPSAPDAGEAVSPRQAAYQATNGLMHLARAARHGREGRIYDAEVAFGAAEQALEPFPFHRALGLRLVAPAAIEDGWGAPRDWLHDAIEFFDAAGHARVVAAIRGLLRRAGEKVPRRGRGDSEVPPDLQSAGITSREMDVLRLAADGLTYRSIAARLYLSPRTVQTHVISILGKLGLESKAELAAHAGRLPDPLDGLPARDAPTHVTPPGRDVGGLPA